MFLDFLFCAMGLSIHMPWLHYFNYRDFRLCVNIWSISLPPHPHQHTSFSGLCWLSCFLVIPDELHNQVVGLEGGENLDGIFIGIMINSWINIRTINVFMGLSPLIQEPASSFHLFSNFCIFQKCYTFSPYRGLKHLFLSLFFGVLFICLFNWLLIFFYRLGILNRVFSSIIFSKWLFVSV